MSMEYGELTPDQRVRQDAFVRLMNRIAIYGAAAAFLGVGTGLFGAWVVGR